MDIQEYSPDIRAASFIIESSGQHIDTKYRWWADD